MAQLVIKGHATRGKEVIEILEMLGGRNGINYVGEFPKYVYTINKHGIIVWYIEYDHDSFQYDIFTLEEFLEKFPYKIGDKVQHKGATSCGSVFEVEEMCWVNNHVQYTVKHLCYNNCHSVATAEDLQLYKEETMEGKITMNEDKGTLVAIDLTMDFRKADAIEVILGDYEFVLKGGKTYFVKKNKYPKTYAECCKILNIPANGDIVYAGNWNDGGEYLDKHLDILRNFQKLRICRDAYWKIAGEQMGLGKPWKPDWTISETKFTIVEIAGIVVKSADMCNKHILAFPTEEMRDAFFEYFKELIEQCKELL
jgi:hypothetical protein